MRAKTLLLPALLALALSQEAAPALAANQVVALFTPEIVDGSGVPGAPADRDALAVHLEQALKDKLQDRFDVRLAGSDAGGRDGDAARRKARVLGATYTLRGVLTRIGRSVALDLMLAPVEEPGKGKTVVVTGMDADAPQPQSKDIPFVYRRLVIEGSAKLKLAFFGDERIGEGAARRKIPRLAGTVGRSRSIPGDAISAAMADTDRDAKSEVVVAYADSIAIYRVEGDDLVEKIRIPDAGGIIRVDAADVNRNGIAEIFVVRYRSGRAATDILEFDGKEYRRIGAGLPFFLRTVDLGPEGIVLVGQESDPTTIFRGPVFRAVLNRPGRVEEKERGVPLPLPAGTWIYSFAPLRFDGKTRFAVLGREGRLSLLDESGGRIWEGMDRISGTDLVLEPPLPDPQGTHGLAIPNRLFAADLDGDKNDELISLNNLLISGGFFENIRVYSNSEALCFAQDGDKLDLAWRTTQIDGAARDAFVASRNPRGPLRIGVATRDKGKILGSFGEWRILWLK